MSMTKRKEEILTCTSVILNPLDYLQYKKKKSKSNGSSQQRTGLA